MRLGAALRRHRAAVVSGLALVLAVSAVIVYAVSAEGYRSHETDLNDGGIWVTNSRDGFYGRINKPIGQLDGALFAEAGANLDIVQDGAAVVGVNRSDGLVSTIDPATVQPPDGEEASIPGSAEVQLAGSTVAVTDPEGGKTWARRVDTKIGLPEVSALDHQGAPITTAGAGAQLAVSQDGTILVASADKDTLTTIKANGAGFDKASVSDLPAKVSSALSVTAVGEQPVVLDSDAKKLYVGDHEPIDVDGSAVLQQPGPDADDVLVATSSALLSIDLESGEKTTLGDGVSGRPTQPVRLGACSYGAWSGGQGAVVTRCGDEKPVVADLGTSTSDLVFRVNRGEILLNDRATGAVWNIDSNRPTRIDNWDAYQFRVQQSDKDEQNEKQNQGDRRPPKAKPDNLGARPGRTTVLHPLDNDTAPQGRILSIRAVQDVRGSDAEVTISPDGQTVQIQLPEQATGTTTFEYFIDDGRRDVSDHATVRVAARGNNVNANPHLREAYKPRQWSVPAEGVLDIPVLPDWRDNEDGDPLSLDSVTVQGTAAAGAVARTTSSGRLRLDAGPHSGMLTLSYGVTDGIGDPVMDKIKVRVQDRLDRQAVAAVAEPDVVSGEVGKPITIRPLGNDLPGSDPVNPDAELALAGKLPETAGAVVRTDLVDGTVTFRSGVAKTYFLDYDAAYGNAPFARGKIRIDVRPSRVPPDAPVALPDTVTLFGQAPSMVDVLANDIDPAGGLLVVQEAMAQSDNQLEVSVVDGRWVRVSARQGRLSPNPQVVHYSISNGQRSGIEGEIVVSQRPAPPDDTPVTETDRVTVRAGASASIPVLDNDYSPAGDPLSLVDHVAGQAPGELDVQTTGDRKVPTGQAMVSGRFVRYVAPPDLRNNEDLLITYLATNAEGKTAPGTVEVTVVAADQPNRVPEPPVLEARVISGDEVELHLPGAGVDPDGDPVTLTGIATPPHLGRVLRFDGSSLVYQAYPGSEGTEEFGYSVSDSRGAVANGTVRVAVVPPAQPQAPLALPDSITVEPGRTATIDVLANDVIANDDRVTVSLVDPPAGVELSGKGGPVTMRAPNHVGRNLEAVYRIHNGIATSQATVTLHTATPWNNPPVVFDAYGCDQVGGTSAPDDPSDRSDADTVSVDVLRTAYDPDGPRSALSIEKVFTPAGVHASIDGGRITVDRGREPLVVPFRVRDGDGGAALASLYVPPAGAGLPYVPADDLIKIDPGQSRSEQLADHVVDPADGTVSFTLKDRIWASPEGRLDARITGDGKFEVTAADGYEGPGAVSFEVTTGTSIDDPRGRRTILTVPVQVGDATAILRCPRQPVEISQGEQVDLDIAAVCHAWTADPAAASSLSFDSDWERSVDGLSIIQPSGPVISVAANGSAASGSEAVLLVRAGGGPASQIRIRVVPSPPPSLAPIRIADMKAGESRTIDLAPYLRPGVSNPDPSLLSAERTSGPDVRIEKSGDTSVTITTADDADGQATFRVEMSDVSGDPGPDRRVEGTIDLEVLNHPDAPRPPIPGRAVRSQEVRLQWQAPDANGAPIDSYQVRDQSGRVTACGTTQCDVTGLTNGKPYTFTVRAHNAVGWSDWSGPSAQATPDAKPGVVGPIRLVQVGDRNLTIGWSKPTTQTSKIERYLISWPGGNKISTSTTTRISGLDNNKTYSFTVQAENAYDVGPQRTSAPFQSVGNPGAPAAPSITDQQTPGDAGAVTVSWGAVNPNGPSPVRYTVLREGAPLPACTNITATSCDNAGIKYDGTRYNYSVRATNAGDKSATGGTTSWDAVGKPADWGDWSLTPTGANNQAKASFTVPSSRGAQSNVKVIADGQVAASLSGTGGQTSTFNVADNNGPHSVALEVCNEKGACSTSSAKSVQTYGPLTSSQITSIQPQVSGTKVNWQVTVDTNGDPAQVNIRSAKRNVTLQLTGVDTQTVTSGSVDVGYSYNETVTVTLSDPSPSRGPASKTASYKTQDPPPKTVTVSRGDKCSDRSGSSLPNCYNGGAGVQCLNDSCGFIVVTLANFPSSVTCTLDSSSEPYQGNRGPFGNGSHQTTAYFGYPNGWVQATCGGVDSPRYDWPNN